MSVDEDWTPTDCPQCGASAKHYDCWNCGGEGFHEVYELDPMWYEPGETEPCETCNGDGSWIFCPTCDRSYRPRAVVIARVP
jgi:DnaJ-class molecular chaperone